MNATYNLLDTDGYGITNSDAAMFITIHDTEFDERLNKHEFNQAISNALFMLVLEDALNSDIP